MFQALQICRIRWAGAALILMGLASPGFGQTWTGATNGFWNNAGNWSPGFPVSNQNTILTFGASTPTALTNNLPGGTFNLNRMNFSSLAPAYVITGNPLNFQTNTSFLEPVIGFDANSFIQLNTQITLTNNLLMAGSGSGTLSLGNTISGAGSITKGSGSTLILSGANSFAGGVAMNGGTVSVSSDGNLGNAAGGLTFNGGTLQITGTTFTSTARTIGWGAGGGGFNINDAANSFTLSQALGAGGALTKSGAGTLVLSNAGNAYTGGTTINGGTLSVGADGNLGNTAGGVTFNGGTLQITGTTFTSTGRTFSLGAGGGTIDVAGLIHTFAVNPAIGGSGGLTKTGAGTLLLANSGNAYAGGTTINVGTLKLGATNALPANGPVTINGGTLDLNGFSASIGSLSGGASTLAIGNELLTVNQTTDGTYQGLISGAFGTLRKTGPGVLTLTNASNSYAGLQIFGGTLSVSDSGQLGNPFGLLDFDGGTLRVTGTTFTSTTKSTSWGVNGGGFDIVDAGNTFVAPPLLSGGPLTKSGAGTLVLSNTNNAYTGVTTINGGTLRLGVVDGIPTGGALTVNAGTFDLNGFTPVIGTLSGAGGTISLGNQFLNIGQNADATYQGTITGTGAVIKFGSSMLTLTNAGNTHSGGTQINFGTISVSSNGALGNAAGALIFAGGTLQITGTTFTSTSRPIAWSANGGAFDINAAGNTFTLGQAIGPGGALTKNGAGTLVLTNGSNSYTGTVVNGGTLRYGATTAISSLGGLIVNSGTLDLNGFSATTSKLSGTGGTISLGNQTLTLSQSNGVNTFFSGNLVGTGTFILQDSGLLTLTGLGSTANLRVDEYLGVNSISGGPSGFGALGSGSLTLNNGNLLYSGPTASTAKVINMSGSSGFWVVDPTATVTLTSAFAPAAGTSFSKVGNGTLVLTVPNNQTGGTKIDQGILQASADNQLGAANSPLRVGPGTFRFGAAFDPGAARPVSIPSGTGTFDTNGFNVTLANAVTGAGALGKTGSGTLTLTNTSNSYSGGTFVNGGTLMLGGGGGAVIPAGSTVTVGSGAVFNTGGQSNPALGIVTLDGGTITIPNSSTTYFMNQLKTTAAGGTVAFNSSMLTALGLVGTTPRIEVNGNSTWTNPSGAGFIGNSSGGELEFRIAPGVLLVSDSIRLFFDPFRFTGGGTYRANSLSIANLVIGPARYQFAGTGFTTSGALALDGGTLDYTGPSATFSKNFALDDGGGTLQVTNAATNLTLTSNISGTGRLTKSGPGTLALTPTTNLYSGGITIQSGRIDITNDSQLGLAEVTVNPAGTLRYLGNTTASRTFHLAGGSLEAASFLALDGATVNGGFLRGAGIYTLTGGTALNGVTTFNSTTMIATGPATANNFANNGTITVNPSQTFGMNFATNGAAGLFTINGTANASDFTSYGRMQINPGGTLNNTLGSIVFAGGSVTNIGIFNPANGQVTPGGVLNFGPGPMRVQGGLVRNNGIITGTGDLIIDFGGVVRGAGEIDTPNAPIRINGGQLIAGNSPGLTRVSNFSLVSTGVTGGDFSNATGIAGPPIGSTGTQLSGWSVFEFGNSTNTGGSAQVQGTTASRAIWQFSTVLDSGNYSTPGVPANFNHMQSYIWQIVRPRSAADVNNPNNTTPTNTVAQISIFDTGTMMTVPLTDANLNAYLRFDDTAFNFGAVPVNERGMFAFVFLPDGLGVANRVIAVTYTPVPEPAFVLAVGAIGVSAWGVWRRSRGKNSRAHSPSHRPGPGSHRPCGSRLGKLLQCRP